MLRVPAVDHNLRTWIIECLNEGSCAHAAASFAVLPKPSPQPQAGARTMIHGSPAKTMTMGCTSKRLNLQGVRAGGIYMYKA